MLEKGRIHIYYGDGKGKTTAAIGLGIRGAGAGLRVLFFQFLKDNQSGERKVLEEIEGITCLYGREPVKFVSRMNRDEKIELYHYNNKVLDELAKLCMREEVDVLILDEAVCATHLNVMSEEKLLEFLRGRPRGLEIVLTGHQLSDRLRQEADYVTKMEKEKHPYDLGIGSRKGIEY